ncbi:MAG: AAA family ATPase [Thermoplasmata archaeon]|nr:AAA family ATPase [Thermoplasmata archaeon]
MKNVYVASLEAGEGKTTAAIAISSKYKSVGYMKPIGDNPAYIKKKIVDYDALLFSNLFGLQAEKISLGMHHSKIMHNYKDALKELRKRYEEIGEKEIFIFEGGESIWKGASLNLDMKSVCNEFDAMPIFVVTGDENEIKDKVSFISSMEEASIIFNKVKNYDELKEFAEENGVKVAGYMPEIKKLRLTKVSYVVEKLNGKVVAGNEGIANYFDGVFIAALSASQIKRHPDFRKKNKLIITGGDRSDAIAACIEENTSAIILTNNIIPSSNILAKADKAGIPLISVRPDTYTIASRVEKLPRPIMADEEEKLKEIQKMAKVDI